MRKGVMRPGHVQIRVMDMDEAVVHYRDRLGMIEVGRDSQNRAYFKGWTEIDAFSVVLREAEEPGMDFMGFKVTDSDTLASLKQDLVDYGCGVETIPAGAKSSSACGRRVTRALLQWALRSSSPVTICQQSPSRAASPSSPSANSTSGRRWTARHALP